MNHFTETYDIVLPHEEPQSGELRWRGTLNSERTADAVTQAGWFSVATHQKEGSASHRQQEKAQHISGQAR